MAGETNVGSIAVFITADTNGLERGVARAKSALNAIGGMAAQAGAAVAGFGVALATGAVVGLASFVKESFSAVDAAAKLADTVDANFQGLRGIQFAGDLAGSSAAGVADAFKKMNKTLGEASLGEKKAADALQNLGLDVFDLVGMDADKAFLKIAQAISQIPIASQKAAAAMDIFGKSGQELLPLLNEGEAGIARMQDEFNRVNGTMNRDGAKVFEELNDTITTLTQAFKGFAESIAKEIAPALKDMAENLTRVLVNLRDRGFFDTLSTPAPEGPKAPLNRFFDKAMVDRVMAGEKAAQAEQQAIIERDRMLENYEQEDAKRRLRIYNALTARQINMDKMRAEAEKKNLDEYLKQSSDSQKKLGARAQELLKQSETPLEQYKNSLLEIRELFEKDLLTADQADKVLESATARFKQTENKKTAPVGFAGQIQARGVSAEALRMSNRKTQVEDPQLKTTNLLLTDMNKNIKTIKTGSAVTV